MLYCEQGENEMNEEYEPIIVAMDKDGKITLTEQEIRQMLKNAYNQGYNAGKNTTIQHEHIILPSTPTIPASPYTPSWYNPLLQGPSCTSTSIDGNIKQTINQGCRNYEQGENDEKI